MIKLLSDKRTSILIILVAIAARAIQLLFYLDSFFDTSFQVIATQNLVQGHGVSTSIVQASDLSNIIYQPLVNWPPGYSLILSPFYIATGNNYLLACFIVDLLAATAIILLCRRILFLLDTERWVINLFTIFTSFFIYYFFYTGSTDSISIAFFLAAISSTISAIKTNDQWNKRGLISAVCLLLSASLKYLFFPIVFALPVFLFIYAQQNRNPAARKSAIISFLVLFAGIACVFIYQKAISGSGAHISSPGRGFFPAHLLRVHPFLPASFVTPNTLRKLPDSTIAPAFAVFRILHVLGLLLIIILAIRSFLRHGLKQASVQRVFILLAVTVAVAISLVLAGLSLFVDKELMPPDRWWTYIEDARYYGIAEILVHIVLFLYFGKIVRAKKRGFAVLILLVPILLLPEIVRGITFTAKRIIRYGKEQYYWQQENEFYQQVANSIQPARDSLNVKQTVVAGSLYYGNHRTALHLKIPVLDDPASLNDPASLKSQNPVLLIAIIRADQQEGFKNFIEYPGTQLAGQFNGFYFYSLYVSPQ